MKSYLLALVLLLGFSAQATFLPENEIKPNLVIQAGPSQTTEEQFNSVIAKFQKIYGPIVKKLGGNLMMSGNWKDETLNAGARQMFGAWTVQIAGGLARRPELTTDGMTLILCHEIGHHLGGFAFVANGPLPFAIWAASEGQADYFATHSCARKIWETDTLNNSQMIENAREDIYRSCSRVWKSQNELGLCTRSLMAAESVSLTMAALKGEAAKPQFITPDPSVVEKTNGKHPATQCRMDTYHQGALCAIAFNEGLIPGKKVRGGVFSENAEKESAAVTCTQMSQAKIGLRPACWFKARF